METTHPTTTHVEAALPEFKEALLHVIDALEMQAGEFDVDTAATVLASLLASETVAAHTVAQRIHAGLAVRVR